MSGTSIASPPCVPPFALLIFNPVIESDLTPKSWNQFFSVISPPCTRLLMLPSLNHRSLPFSLLLLGLRCASSQALPRVDPCSIEGGSVGFGHQERPFDLARRDPQFVNLQQRALLSSVACFRLSYGVPISITFFSIVIRFDNELSFGHGR
jgi:hypothetical protein